MGRKRRGTPLSATLGGIIVGFDQQVWRSTPPPHELVKKRQPVRWLAGEGVDLGIELPSGETDGPGSACAWPRPRAVLLDLDGLSVDSEPLHHESVRRALAELGVEHESASLVHLFGQPARASNEYLARLHGLDADEISRRRASHFDELIAVGLPFRPGFVEAAMLLSGAGLSLGLVSSGLRRHVARAADQMAAAGVPLGVVIAREDVERPKPDPEPYLAAAAALCVEPAEAVVFEDAPAGMRAGLDAGMRCVIVPNEDTAGADFTGATAVLPDLVSAARWVLHELESRR